MAGRILKLLMYALSHPGQIFKCIYYKLRMERFGWSSIIEKPLKIDGINNICIGDKVIIQHRTWLASLPLTGERSSELVIKDGCIIGHYNHIYSTKSIIINKNVLTADRVYISDNIHGYEDINIPILKQTVKQMGKVEIGEGSWLGENVCVIGASIGKHCVIGANSVVTKDIPDYSVAVGSPARVIKRYNFDEQKWVRI